MAQWTGTSGDLTTQNDDLAKNNDVDNSDLSSKSGDFTNKLRDLSKNFLGICQTKNGFVSTKKSWPETMVKINYHLNKKRIFCTVSMTGISSYTRSPGWVFWRVNVPRKTLTIWVGQKLKQPCNPGVLFLMLLNTSVGRSSSNILPGSAAHPLDDLQPFLRFPTSGQCSIYPAWCEPKWSYATVGKGG